MPVQVAMIQHHHYNFFDLRDRIVEAVENNLDIFHPNEKDVYEVSVVDYPGGIAVMQGINVTVDLETGNRVFIQPEHEDSGEAFKR